MTNLVRNIFLMSEAVNPKIDESWKGVLAQAFNAPEFGRLKQFLVQEKNQYKVFPPGSKIFEAFNLTPFHKVKVVIIGQDPYHNDGQAHGLCFSVPQGIQIPPSLVNIFKELEQDVGIAIPNHGRLDQWARQGVLLLNAILTVRAHQAGSHRNKGWEEFTDAAIRAVSEQREHVVFLLWGSFAQQKSKLIDANKHLILKTVHPSPLSAYRGFFGCRHFSKTNDFLISKGLEPINWQV